LRNLDTPLPAPYGARRFGVPRGGADRASVLFGMSEHGTPDDLKSLGERLDKARRDRRGPAAGDGKSDDATNSALGLGFRIGMELVVAVVFGLGLGWLVDQGLGTRPLAMILGMFLGFAAGIVNVYRAMKGLGLAAGYRPADKSATTEEDEEE
jgi:ATP synthase protein I